jgi:hypothetical protein
MNKKTKMIRHVIVLLFVCQFAKAQKDTLNSKVQLMKFEIGVTPITVYNAPPYFANKHNLLFVSRLKLTYYINPKNAIRASFNFNNAQGEVYPIGASQYDTNEKLRQYSIGFQHTLANYKKISTYLFTDAYYQSSQLSTSTSYISPPSQTQSSSDSTMFLSKQINSFNLIMGAGIKFTSRRHIFILAESGLGLSYYTGTQHAHGSVSSSSLNTSTGQSSYSNHQVPIVNTLAKGINFNGNIIRIAFGIIF